MGIHSRAVTLGIASAIALAASGWGMSSAFGATGQAAGHGAKQEAVFKTEHVAGAKGQVLVEGRGLVVYTFTGDTRGKPGTCTGQCEAVWPEVHGVPVVAHGVKLTGKFGSIRGQVTYNGWPLYLFTGEKPGQDRADSAFKVVVAGSSATTPKPAPAASPTPTPTGGGGW
jgi:predicted lipoprotein with Yx(FWY)xxD motif